jgi:hypothetical protein
MAMQINLTRNVSASPSEAFATVADLVNWPQIIGSVQSVELLTPDSICEGAKLRVSRFLFGRETTQLFHVAELKPPRQLRLFVEDPNIHFDLDHVIESVFGGACRIMLIFRSRPGTQVEKAAQPFLSPLMGVTLRDELEQDLLDLATAITVRSSSTEARRRRPQLSKANDAKSRS